MPLQRLGTYAERASRRVGGCLVVPSPGADGRAVCPEVQASSLPREQGAERTREGALGRTFPTRAALTLLQPTAQRTVPPAPRPKEGP